MVVCKQMIFFFEWPNNMLPSANVSMWMYTCTFPFKIVSIWSRGNLGDTQITRIRFLLNCSTDECTQKWEKKNIVKGNALPDKSDDAAEAFMITGFMFILFMLQTVNRFMELRRPTENRASCTSRQVNEPIKVIFYRTSVLFFFFLEQKDEQAVLLSGCGNWLFRTWGERAALTYSSFLKQDCKNNIF